MSIDQSPLIFDGHNDLLLRIFEMADKKKYRYFFDGFKDGHLDLPRMKKGGFGGGFFAIFVPSPQESDGTPEKMLGVSYDLPLPAQIQAPDALPTVLSMVAILNRLERESKGQIKVCTSAAEVRRCFELKQIAIIMHIEGAEVIDDDFNALEVLYRAGLRSVGLVWSRPSRFGHGVPFRFPGSPDVGPGLTDLGKKLVQACNQLNMVVDLAHLNEAGFWDAVKISDAPLVVSHANCHTLCFHSRNLTDKQLRAVGESGGIVGVNFATGFIRADGQMRVDTDLKDLLRHMDHLIDHAGIDSVGFGSDFDGAKIPEGIGDVAGLTNLRKVMVQHGYDKETMTKLCHGNWLRVLERTFKC